MPKAIFLFPLLATLAQPVAALTLDLPAKVLGEESRSEIPGSYALPTAAFDGSSVPSRQMEGALDQRAFRLDARGMTTLAPGLSTYLERLPKTYVDGGYYTKTQENRPLIGPLPVEGAYIFGALSGYGLMAACAGGELLAAHVTGGTLPSYAPAFLPSRYADAGYQERLAAWGATGQL